MKGYSFLGNTAYSNRQRQSSSDDSTFHDLMTIPLVQSQCRKIKLLLAVTRICNKRAVQTSKVNAHADANEKALKLELYRISAPAMANPKSGHFLEIRPSPAPAKFLAGFARSGGCQCSGSTFSYLRIELTLLTCQVVCSQF